MYTIEVKIMMDIYVDYYGLPLHEMAFLQW